MRKSLLIFGMILVLLLSSCVYGSGGDAEPDMGNASETEPSASHTTTEAPRPPMPEIPNEAEDGYSKRY